MLGLLGNLTLYCAIIFAVLQSTLPLWGLTRNHIYFQAFARPCAIGQFIFVCSALVILSIAFITNDFTLTYVAMNSHPSLPLLYRSTALWGAHEGSILLWIVVLNAWTIFFTLVQKNNRSMPLVLSILGWLSLSFLLFLIFTSNPFLPATQLMTGQDLNPLLQDPGFIIHPPMLYLGYVGFSVAFALTFAGLLSNRLDATWARLTRQFALAAWCCLTFGIILGSWWAYRVLGWGGFWFWDPIENASLLPWLAGTGLIHVLLLVEKRQVGKSWAVMLAFITFTLSVLGTFLARSGVLISAHTFASDPSRGVFLLLLLGLLIFATLLIYLLRLPLVANSSAPRQFKWISRESGLILNSAFMLTAMLTVLIGTLYPLILEVLNLGTISVGPPYFNLVMLPLVFLGMTIMIFAPLCNWEFQTLKKLWQLTWKKMLLSFSISGFICFFLVNSFSLSTWLGFGLSLWMLSTLLNSHRLSFAMTIAHAGFAIFILGILVSSLLSVERQIRIQPGGSAQLGPYQFLFLDTRELSGSNFQGIQAIFEVTKQNRHIVTLYPEKRIYTVREMVMSKVAIHPSIFRDLYIALGEPLTQQQWSVRIYYKPFIRWIWFGGLLMILGGLISFIRRPIIIITEKINPQGINP